ncbi:MAG: conserved membrane protein of unknown function [Promethearchaeota archaeon]|nr:MAG: conserved membrane protein of unknown function [Candidatus Lokiarchaeota archaeon]
MFDLELINKLTNYYKKCDGKISTKQYQICGVCGYISSNKDHFNQCPACGAPISVFKPYEYNVSEKRLTVLNVHIHPVMTHFPGSFAVIQLLLFILSFFNLNLSGIPLGYGGVLDFFIVIFPAVVLLTMLTGILDGKLRYQQIQTPHLKKKVILGISLFMVSLLMVLFHTFSNQGQNTILVIFEGISILLALGLNGILGRIGGELVCGLKPRGKEV